MHSSQKPHGVGHVISNPQENSEISNVSCVESESLSSLSGQQQGTNPSQGEEKMAIGQEQDIVTRAEEFPPGPFLFRSPVYPTHCVLWSWHSWTRTCLTFDLGFTFLSTMPLTPGQNYQQRSSPTGSPLSPLATPSFGKLWRWVSMSETIVYCKPTLETPAWAS